VDQNATRAAIAAGCGRRSARQQGSRWLTNADIRAEIARQTRERCEKLGVTADEVIAGLKKLAFFDIRKCFRQDGSLKPVPELDDETAYALRSMDTKEAYRHFGRGKAKAVGVIEKIRMADKGLNLERLGRSIALFKGRVEVEVEVNLAERIAAGRKRVMESQDRRERKKTPHFSS
jgi:phage terminase small subunit